MIDLIPRNLEEALLTHVKRAYLPQRFGKHAAEKPFSQKDVNFFAPAVAELSAAFTSERRDRAQNYLHRKEYRSAYLLYFFLTNYAKAVHCLKKLKQQGSLPQRPQLSILDIGCGPGTALLAAQHALGYGRTKVQLTGLEQNKSAIEDAQELWSACASGSPVPNFIHAEASSTTLKRALRGSRYDLIIAANVLNEFESPKEAHELCRTLVTHHLVPDGVLLIIDPALQRCTRLLMEMRDALVADGARVLLPCLHQLRCPMLAANKRDWCHVYIEWKCPKVIRDFDRLIGNKHDYLKLATFAFAPASAELPHVVETSLATEQWRVVSSPMFTTGKAEMLLCGSNGELKRIDELERSRVKGADAFNGARRGDIVSWPADQSRVDAEHALKVLQPWNRN